MRKHVSTLAIAAFIASLGFPAQAARFDTAAGAKQEQSDQVAKKGKSKKPKAPKKA